MQRHKSIARGLLSAALLLTGCAGQPRSAVSASPANSIAPAVSVSGATATPTVQPEPGSAAATGELEVFSWWTSGMESDALQELYKAVRAANPQLKTVDATLVGSSATSMQEWLDARLAANDVLTSWQTHVGSPLDRYARQGVAADLTSLYKENGWLEVMPEALVASLTVNGKISAVPTGVHRNSVLWWNKALMAQAGITLAESATWAQVTYAAKALKDKNIPPLCLGDRDVWTAATLLEGMLVGELGADGWLALLDGTREWRDPTVIAVLNHFYEALTWTNNDHESLDWTLAIGRLAEGKCAMNVMGDWAYVELVTKHRQVEGTDFEASILGDASTFITVTDVFIIGEGSKNPNAGAAWARAIMNPETQVAFSEKKGSTPVRSDADLRGLGQYTQAAAKSLAGGTLVPSVVHSQTDTPISVVQAFSGGIGLLRANGDGARFATVMDAAIAAGKTS